MKENATALISRMLVSIGSDTTLWQQRVLFSALGAFNQYDKELHEEIKVFDSQRKISSQLKLGLSGLGSEWEVEENRESIAKYFHENITKCDLRMDIAGFCKYWLDSDTKWNHVKNIKDIEGIRSTGYTYRYTDSEGNESLETVSVFSTVKLHGNECISLRINPDFMPYIIFFNNALLKAGYTKVPLGLLKCSSSQNTFNFTAMILRHLNKNKANIQTFVVSIDDIREYTCTTHKYQDYKDLKRYVIDRALRDINGVGKKGSETAKIVEYCVHQKQGNRVKSLMFTAIADKLLSKSKNEDGQDDLFGGLGG